MARKKTTIKGIVKKPKKEVKKTSKSRKADATIDLRKKPPTLEVKEKQLPEYKGVQVVAVLEDGHTKEFIHCQMANGTTQHVPREFLK